MTKPKSKPLATSSPTPVELLKPSHPPQIHTIDLPQSAHPAQSSHPTKSVGSLQARNQGSPTDPTTIRSCYSCGERLAVQHMARTVISSRKYKGESEYLCRACQKILWSLV